MARQPHGQNFLIDNNIAANIVKAVGIGNDDDIIEIGPGKGALTNIIIPIAQSLTLIEIDQTLANRLSSIYSGNPKIKIVNVDALKYDFPQTAYKIVSNLPYNVGTAIIQRFLPNSYWSTAVLMLQKEVAQRLAAKTGTADYGYISIFCQYYAQCEILFDVSPGCFHPKPKVMSTVIKLINKRPQPPNELFFPFIKHCFSMRRKTILNALRSFKLNPQKKSGIDSQFSTLRDDCEKILTTLNLDPKLRPDKLTINDYILLTNKLKKDIILQS
jgi:16S rRNA (adenine1518-N6/adenine1519-N6)-dimethyltransferase